MEILAGYFAGFDGATVTALIVGTIAVFEALKAQDGLCEFKKKVERERRQDAQGGAGESGSIPLGPGTRCGD